MIREPKGNRRSKSGRWSRSLKWTSLFIFLAGVIMVMGIKVDEIAIDGTVVVCPEELSGRIGIRQGMPWWKVLSVPVEENLEILPRIKRVEVSLRLLRRVEILVTEREAVALVLEKGRYLAVDGSGMVMGTPADDERGLLVVTGIDVTPLPGEYLAGKGKRKAFVSFFETWSNGSPLSLSELNLSDERNLKVYTAGGLEVLVGDSSNLDQKIGLLTSSLPRLDLSLVSGPIDLRIGGMLIFNTDGQD